MEQTITELLNKAASQDPDLVVTAGQQLLLLTSTNDETKNPVYVALAKVVFSSGDATQLTVDGQFIGLIHLKNVLFDSRIWQSLTQAERDHIKQQILNFVASGRQPLQHLNSVEQTPRVGSCVSELVARFVRNEWLKEGWSDVLWQQLIDCCAWTSLRLAVRAAASFRLPARRKAFLKVINSLLPNLVNLWHGSFTNPTSFEYCTLLSRLLYTCIAAIGANLKTGPFLFSEDRVVLAGQLFETSFAILEKLSYESPSDNQARFGPAVLTRRVAKLSLAIFMACAPSVRGQYASTIMSQITNQLSSIKTSMGLDEKSAKWLLALIYSILPCCTMSEPLLDMSEDGISTLRSWFFSADAEKSHNHIAGLLLTIVHQFLPLSDGEVVTLIERTEECLSTGGSTGDGGGGGGNGSGNPTNAACIWDVDGQTRELLRTDLRSVLGLHGSEQQIQAFGRQLAELICTQCVASHDDQFSEVLLQLISHLQTNLSTAMQFECLLRLVQLCLPHRHTDQRWVSLSEYLLQASVEFLKKHSASAHQDLSMTPSVRYGLPILLTRILTLSVRCAIYCDLSGYSPCVTSRCCEATAQLVQFLGTSPPFAIESKAMLCVRLAAANSLSWLLSQPLFPSESIAPHLHALFANLVQLIQDVSECETRVHLLGILCKLIESTDLVGDTQLTSHLLGVLDNLWHLDQRSTALRANILDAISLLLLALNAADETDSQLIQFRENLQAPIVTLILTAVQECDAFGTEALFDPCLRLWLSAVSGEGARWSPALECLMPALVGSTDASNSGGDHSKCRPSKHLLHRVDTAEQAELIFRIAEGSLLLVCSHSDRDQLVNFLRRWTEPFWCAVLQETTGIDGQGLESLYSTANALGDDESPDNESQCRIKLLHLLTLWLSVYVDMMPDGTGQLSPSLFGLMAHATRACLKRAPVNMHEDVCPRATQMRLGLLARLAICPGYWNVFLHLVQLALVPSSTDNSLQLPTATNVNVPPSSDADDCQLVGVCLTRWLARADSVSGPIDRRCFALSCLMALRFCAQSSGTPLTDSFAVDATVIDTWAASNTLHANWLEPVVNLCIQVLFDEERGPASCTDISRFPHPQLISTRSSLVRQLLSEFASWQECVGGPVSADALFRCHVDPVLRAQLDTQLSGYQLTAS
ncbi:hypothetical protein CSKR_109291 [Clonorchis sinensis]|uniref:Uncharacterized protein n=1 Tax=Clonorchis sinensis TaxID=79923 RepID=A0A8T1M0H8_CLOSI|nr:hypothetical protein CSKR_109291 [Clonorchis sinensis]